MNATCLQIGRRLDRASSRRWNSGQGSAFIREAGDGAKLMLRLLLLGLIGVAAYRIGSEFLRTIPSDFEPVPAPSGNPEQSRATDQGQSNSEFRGGHVGDR
jgi:hypothetical protein